MAQRLLGPRLEVRVGEALGLPLQPMLSWGEGAPAEDIVPSLNNLAASSPPLAFKNLIFLANVQRTGDVLLKSSFLVGKHGKTHRVRGTGACPRPGRPRCLGGQRPRGRKGRGGLPGGGGAGLVGAAGLGGWRGLRRGGASCVIYMGVSVC